MVAVFGMLSFFGGIVALIMIVVQAIRKKPSWKKCLLAYGITSVVFVACLLIDAPSTDTSDLQFPPIANIFNAEPEHKLEFVKAKMVTVSDRSKLVGVFFNYHNMSDNTYLPCEAINVKAFQHGIEIPVMVYVGTKIEGAVQCDTAIQAGASAYVIWTFEPEDYSTVSIETTDGQKFEVEIK